MGLKNSTKKTKESKNRNCFVWIEDDNQIERKFWEILTEMKADKWFTKRRKKVSRRGFKK